MPCFKQHLKCVCVRNTKWYDFMCVSDWVQYWRVHILLEKCNCTFPKRNLVSSLQTTKLDCLCMYVYWENQSNCAISIWCVYWITRCPWGCIFLQKYLITYCETVTKCAHVGLRVATEFDFTIAFVVWLITRCTLLHNLWRLDMS
jgi:hypothetical protein